MNENFFGAQIFNGPNFTNKNLSFHRITYGTTCSYNTSFIELEIAIKNKNFNFLLNQLLIYCSNDNLIDMKYTFFFFIKRIITKRQ